MATLDHPDHQPDTSDRRLRLGAVSLVVTVALIAVPSSATAQRWEARPRGSNDRIVTTLRSGMVEVLAFYEPESKTRPQMRDIARAADLDVSTAEFWINPNTGDQVVEIQCAGGATCALRRRYFRRSGRPVEPPDDSVHYSWLPFVFPNRADAEEFLRALSRAARETPPAVTRSTTPSPSIRDPDWEDCVVYSGSRRMTCDEAEASTAAERAAAERKAREAAAARDAREREARLTRARNASARAADRVADILNWEGPTSAAQRGEVSSPATPTLREAQLSELFETPTTIGMATLVDDLLEGSGIDRGSWFRKMFTSWGTALSTDFLHEQAIEAGARTTGDPLLDKFAVAFSAANPMHVGFGLYDYLSKAHDKAWEAISAGMGFMLPEN